MKRKCDCWLGNNLCKCEMEELKEKVVKFEDVKSSQIRQIGYMAEDRTMCIKFRNNKLYSYYPVTQEQYDEFKKSESIGSYFHMNFKMNSELKIDKQ